MKAITYRVYLDQPLLTTQILGDPSSSVSFNYILGSQVRGMLIHRYIERYKLHEKEVSHNTDARRLFFNGTTRFLHAYPLVKGDRRSLATSRALFKRKNDEDIHTYTAFNAAHEDFDRDDAESDDTLKPLGQPFCIIDSDKLMLHAPTPNNIAVHTQHDRSKGRATAEKGAIFQYEALAAGQWFGGAILLDDDANADATILSNLLQGIAWLGRSRSAGYGKTTIELGVEYNSEWHEIGGKTPTLTLGQQVTLTLLSDTILHNPTGHPVLTLDAATLGTYLGVPVRIDDAHSFSAIEIHGGFNRTWQLPLAQNYALAAGTTIVFTPQQTLDANAVRRLEQQGIGARRVEGFGRIAFNWLKDDTFSVSKSEPYPKPIGTEPSLTITGSHVATDMACRLLEHRIDEEIAKFVRDTVIGKREVAKNMPANSQLGRVRVLLRRAIREGNDLSVVRTGLKDFKDAGKRQFEQSRIENISLWDWLNRLVAEPPVDDVWAKIRLNEAQWPTVVDQHAPNDAARTRLVTLRLIDETLAAAARARKRGE